MRKPTRVYKGTIVVEKNNDPAYKDWTVIVTIPADTGTDELEYSHNNLSIALKRIAETLTAIILR